jgi:hypothetical protein
MDWRGRLRGRSRYLHLDSALSQKVPIIYENRTNIFHYCASKFGKVITRGSVDSFLITQKNAFGETTSKPQEDAPLQVPQDFLFETISRMEEAVQSCVCHLVLKLDEVRASEWEDRKSKNVVVPTATDYQTIHHGINWNLKHFIVIICVVVSGEHVIPDIIRSQESDDLRKALRKKGIEFERHLILKKSQKPYVNSKSFPEYAKSTFIPHVTRTLTEMGIEQEYALLLMDNWPSHFNSPVK